MNLDPPVVNGVVHCAYDNPRDEVIRLVPREARQILDVGCSTGAMGASLEERGQRVTGIEADPGLAERASARLHRVIEADVEVLVGNGSKMDRSYDCIIFADVLEHLRNPWSVTRWAAAQLAVGGSMVISVPNIRHARLIRDVVLRQYWPYEEIGIFDRTHLRFFARRNLSQLLEGTGLSIQELRRSFALSLNPRSRWNYLAPYLGDFGTLQFIFRAGRPDVR